MDQSRFNFFFYFNKNLFFKNLKFKFVTNNNIFSHSSNFNLFSKKKTIRIFFIRKKLKINKIHHNFIVFNKNFLTTIHYF